MPTHKTVRRSRTCTVYDGEDGFLVGTHWLTGTATQGRSLEEVFTNLREALALAENCRPQDFDILLQERS